MPDDTSNANAAAPTEAAPSIAQVSSSSASAHRKPPYVNIRQERPAPEDLTPTLPREAIAYLEEHASKAAAGSIAAMTPAPPEVRSASSSAPSSSATVADDDDPDSGWDTPSEPKLEAAPLVPQVPVVLTSSSPALAGLPPPAPLSPRPAEAHVPFGEAEDLSARHVFAEVDDSLPTPAINGLPEGMVDPIPLPRPPEGSFTAPFLLYGPTPPPPMHTANAAAHPSSASRIAAAPVASASPDSPVAPPVTLDANASASSSPQLPAADLADPPVVPAPAHSPQKTQKIVRNPNAPRLVPEVMTPALLSAGPYRGEVHLEASASGPALPAIAGLVAPAPLMPGMVRDAQPTVLAQHRLQAAARAATEESFEARRPKRAVLAAIGLGSMAGVLLLGVLGLGIGRSAPPPLVHTSALVASRLMLTALRDVDRAPPAAAPVEVATAPTFHSSAAPPERAPEPPTTTSKRPKHAAPAPAAAPAVAKRGPVKATSDGF